MFVLKDKRTGKYLKNFSGSYNRARDHISYKISSELKLPFSTTAARKIDRIVHNRMWCLDTSNGAKLYISISGIKSAFYSKCHKRNPLVPKDLFINDGSYYTFCRDKGIKSYIKISFEEAFPWIEIVEIITSIRTIKF